jgi:hypothetical protein
VPNPAVPPDGFRWVEPDPVPRVDPGPSSKPGTPRWWLIAAAVVVVAALAVGGVLAWRFGRSSPKVADPLIGTPKNMLVSFALNREPVGGWRISVVDIGLPPKVGVGSVFSSDGDKVFFLTKDCGGDCGQAPTGHEGPSTSFVYGLDLRTGARLYPPVRLPNFGGSTCHGNGPSAAVCLGFDHDMKPTAYVVDLERGAVTYSGPNELKQPQEVGEQYGVTRLVDQQGDGYQVGFGSGVYGIGSHAEHTWFVPGKGSVTVPGSAQVNDMASLSLAVQSDSDGKPDRVFSVIDGRDLTPTAPEGAKLDSARVFQGGFAYQFTKDTGEAGLLIYDASGRLLDTVRPERLYLQDSAALPIALNRKTNTWIVYSTDGVPLVDIPATDLVANFKTIASTLFVQKPVDLHNTDEENPWQQWDLLNGKSTGPECKLDFSAGSYVGSDDHVVITAGEHSGQTIAVDTATCKTIWQFPERTDVWKVGTGLLRSDFPYDAITSLRAPG